VTSGRSFALIGVAGFVAPRHLKAIHATRNRLVASVDPHDSVGVLDNFFPDADFFVEFERFDRHVDKLRRQGTPVDYVSICSPNYLHDSHIRFALRSDAHAICEKPLVLNPWNVEALKELEAESGHTVSTVLQLRLHPVIEQLKATIDGGTATKRHDVDLTYVAPRGNWYSYSWKGDPAKSGGVATNIGIHFFDMLQWVFGAKRASIVHLSQPTRAAGYLELENARVRWYLSLEADDVPNDATARGTSTYRSIRVDGEELEFSGGFADLHTRAYEGILAGQGFGLEDAAPSVRIVHEIRNAAPIGAVGEYHPLTRTALEVS
jgi:UDP-N-acetyl-2-amino-2-deoxyglucuronate dehydrogenase